MTIRLAPAALTALNLVAIVTQTFVSSPVARAADDLQADDAKPTHFSGQLSSKFQINDDSPESSVPPDKEKNAYPLEFGYFVQDLLARAEQARKNKKYAALVAYDRAIAAAVPDQAKGWSQLCDAYRLVNDFDRAARACKNAIARPGAEVDDFVRFVAMSVKRQAPLTEEERAGVVAALAHLETETAPSVTISDLRCQLAVKTSDVPLLETCSAALAEVAPADPRTVVYQWSLAVRKGQNGEAARLLERARDLGLPAENLDGMRKFTPAASGRWRAPWAIVAGAALLMGGLLIAFVRTRRRRGPITAGG